MKPLEPDQIFRSDGVFTEYSTGGSRVVLYGLFNPKTNEWYTGNPKKWAGTSGLMPSTLMHSQDEAERKLKRLKAPADISIVKVLAVYIPISKAKEENHEDVRNQG